MNKNMLKWSAVLFWRDAQVSFAATVTTDLCLATDFKDEMTSNKKKGSKAVSAPCCSKRISQIHFLFR